MWNKRGVEHWRSAPQNLPPPDSNFFPQMVPHSQIAPRGSFQSPPTRFGQPRPRLPAPPLQPLTYLRGCLEPSLRTLTPPLPPPPPPPAFLHRFSENPPSVMNSTGLNSSMPLSPSTKQMPIHTQTTEYLQQETGLSPLSNLNSNDELHDSSWIQKWSSNVELQGHRMDATSQIKINEIQHLLVSYSDKLTAMKKIHRTMSDLESILDDEEWHTLCLSVETTKNELAPLATILEDPNYVLKVKSALNNRRDKRKRAKLSRNKNKVKQERLKQTLLEKEEKIDAWRKQLIEEEASKNEAEKLKKEADAILGEVRGKLDEASKLKKLLDALHKLRKARLTKGESHGFITTATADKCFTKMTEELDKMVETQSQQYKLEEQTLKVMMEESPNVKFQKSSSLREDKIEDLEQKMKIREIYFGDGERLPRSQEERQFCQSFTAAEESLEMLIQRRTEWDQYLSEWESPLSTGIPLNYVIPPSSPQGTWKLYHAARN